MMHAANGRPPASQDRKCGRFSGIDDAFPKSIVKSDTMSAIERVINGDGVPSNATPGLVLKAGSVTSPHRA
jgi:hypothetical protein